MIQGIWRDCSENTDMSVVMFNKLLIARGGGCAADCSVTKRLVDQRENYHIKYFPLKSIQREFSWQNIWAEFL